MKKKPDLSIPPLWEAVIRSDIRSYLRSGYSFADFKDRNTMGRKYGDDLKAVWREEKQAYDKENG